MIAARNRLSAALALTIAPLTASGAVPIGQTLPPVKAVARHLASSDAPKRMVPTPPLDPNGPAKPFVLDASAPDRTMAEHCLAQAVYFEAGTQPLEGREAVAQTVVNRLRHPAYPKSVCGVVYEGSALRTGCQFSFTCDGSLRRAIDPFLWDQAEAVARQALNGFVMSRIGEATYYHADYVRPYWAGALKRITQIGAHIFYRWPGASGDAAAFTGQYAGDEADLSAVLRATDPRLATLRPAVLRRPGARTPELRDAVARRDMGGFRMIEATYTTATKRRVESVIPAAAFAPPAIHPAKVTLPPVHPTVVATANPVEAVAAK